LKAFLDTSVLVAVFYGEHEHHEASFDLFRSLNPRSGCTAAHCLAELYSVITGMPGRDRASPDEALLFLGDVREKLSLVALGEADYFSLISEAASARISGGGVFDAIAGRCALKAKARTLYTWNVKHFRRLSPELASRVKTPGDS